MLDGDYKLAKVLSVVGHKSTMKKRTVFNPIYHMARKYFDLPLPTIYEIVPIPKKDDRIVWKPLKLVNDMDIIAVHVLDIFCSDVHPDRIEALSGVYYTYLKLSNKRRNILR